MRVYFLKKRHVPYIQYGQCNVGPILSGMIFSRMNNRGMTKLSGARELMVISMYCLKQ